MLTATATATAAAITLLPTPVIDTTAVAALLAALMLLVCPEPMHSWPSRAIAVVDFENQLYKIRGMQCTHAHTKLH